MLAVPCATDSHLSRRVIGIRWDSLEGSGMRCFVYNLYGGKVLYVDKDVQVLFLRILAHYGRMILSHLLL